MIEPTYFSIFIENDNALCTLLDGTTDAMFVYGDQAESYRCAQMARTPPTYPGIVNCGMALVKRLLAYLHTGSKEWTRTTLSIAKIGAGLATGMLNPCIDAFLQTEEYNNLCVEYEIFRRTSDSAIQPLSRRGSLLGDVTRTYFDR